MGWANGSTLAEQLWGLVREHISPAKRQEIARGFIKAFEDRDCDTIYECEKLTDDARERTPMELIEELRAAFDRFKRAQERLAKARDKEDNWWRGEDYETDL